MKLRLALIVVLVALLSAETCATPSPADSRSPIRSTRDLERHLSPSGSGESPLAAMPPGARKRFLAELQFGDAGVVGFGTADLEETLTTAQLSAVLGLFGLESYATQLSGLDAPLPPHPVVSEFETRFDAFEAAFGAGAGKDSPACANAYFKLSEGEDAASLASTLDAYDRGLLFRAMLRVLACDAVSGAPAQAVELLELLRAQGGASARRIRALFDALVEIRHFDLAEQVLAEHPASGLPSLPPRRFAADGEALPNTMLQLDGNAEGLSRSVLDLDRGLHIVVVAGCHFARDAATAIRADPELDRIFRSHATWLAPQGESLAAVADWNREFPEHRIHVAWRNRDWPRISSWRMPSFYVFENGELRTSWSGWPADTGGATLRAQLQNAGVID